MKKSLYIILMMSILSLSGIAQDTTIQVEEKKDEYKWFVPSHMRLQYAGNVGFISAGPAWEIWKQRFEVAVLFGYVPRPISESPLFLTSMKLVYTPTKLNVNMGERLLLKPISIGFVANHTFGHEYNKYLDQSQYPAGYYWWGVPIRMGFTFHSELEYQLKMKRIKRVSFYFELSYWDLYFYSQLANGNGSVVNFWDASTLGFGTKIFFRD